MAIVSKKEAQKIQVLYCSEKLSARQIADKLGYSLEAVYYAMRKYGIKRRKPAENSKIQFERKPLSFKVRSRLSKKDTELKLAGVMLYWSEGYKTEKSYGIDFANSDITMLKLFISFLRVICGVDEKRLRIFLYCHTSVGQKKLVDFWSEQLNVPVAQFTKPYVRKDYRVDKSNKMPYGLVHIRYADKKLLALILSWIEEYKKQFRVGGRVVNYTTL